MAGPWVPPESERDLGLGFYASEGPGIGGTLKARPEDFRVREVSLYPRPDPDGPFVVLRILSRNWEQHELGQRLAAALGLPSHAVRWAGTKDRRAIAERLASYRGPMPPEGFGLPGAEVLEAYRSREGLVLGHHFGNTFDVHLGQVEGDDAGDRIRRIRDELRSFGGFPNFFGPQRFGEVRPVTHRVGRALVQGDVGRAVDLYLTDEVPGGDLRGQEARRAYASHHDAARALREFPPEFRFERILLDHLARGNPPERAFRALPRDLRILFVHAYQSLIFNRYLTERVRRGGSCTGVVAGDHLLRVARDGTIPGHEAVPVGPDNLPEAIDTVARGRAVLAGPLPGTATARDASDDLLSDLLREEGIDAAAFGTPRTPEVASDGAWRPLLVPLPPIDLRADDASGADGERDPGGWRLQFTLPRGSYATVLLREFRKVGATRAG